jgi:hypothetical protein
MVFLRKVSRLDSLQAAMNSFVIPDAASHDPTAFAGVQTRTPKAVLTASAMDGVSQPSVLAVAKVAGFRALPAHAGGPGMTRCW